VFGVESAGLSVLVSGVRVQDLTYGVWERYRARNTDLILATRFLDSVSVD
jgi:hypothetical protein